MNVAVTLQCSIANDCTNAWRTFSVTAGHLVLVYCLITSILITVCDTRADTASRQRQKPRSTWRPPLCRSLCCFAWLKATATVLQNTSQMCYLFIVGKRKQKRHRPVGKFAALRSDFRNCYLCVDVSAERKQCRTKTLSAKLLRTFSSTLVDCVRCQVNMLYRF